jgi:hypothetical protein
MIDVSTTSTAIGYGALTNGFGNSAAMGYGAYIGAADSIAIGENSDTYGQYASSSTYPNATYSTTIGWGHTEQPYDISMGYNVVTQAEGDVAIGTALTAGAYGGGSGKYAFVFGHNISSVTDNSLTVGFGVATGPVLILKTTGATCNITPLTTGLSTSCSSDARLKKDIGDAASQLGIIRRLKIHEYTVRATGERTTGVIAQEVRQVMPELVTTGEDGMLSVTELDNWKLVKALQELDETALKIARDGTVNVSGDLRADDDKWGNGTGWMACEDQSSCRCPDGQYITGVNFETRQIYCNKL